MFLLCSSHKHRKTERLSEGFLHFFASLSSRWPQKLTCNFKDYLNSQNEKRGRLGRRVVHKDPEVRPLLIWMKMEWSMLIHVGFSQCDNMSVDYSWQTIKKKCLDMVLAIVTSTSWQSPVVELYTEHIHRVSFLKQTSKHDQVTRLTETSHTGDWGVGKEISQLPNQISNLRGLRSLC